MDDLTMPGTEPLPAPPLVPTTDQADPLLAQIKDSQRLALRETLRVANSQNPDAAAGIMKLATATRLHPSTVAEVEQDAKAAVAVQNADVDGLLRDHPELSAWLLDRSNASVAHDDLPGLRALDGMVRQVTAGRYDDPLGILPKGYQFDGNGGIKRVYSGGQFADQVGDYQGLAQDLQRTQEQGVQSDIQRQERDQRVGAMANPFVAGAVGALGGDLRVLQTLGGSDTSGLQSQLADIAGSSSEQNPGLANDAARMGAGLAADLPLMFSGAPVAKAAMSLGMAATTIRALTPILGATRAAKAGEGVTVAASMSPIAAKSGIISGQDNGAGYGAVDALINLAIPAGFGRVGVQRFLTPAIADLGSGGAKAAIPAATFLLKQAGLDAAQNQVTELATAIHEYATGVDPEALTAAKLVPRLGLAGAAGGLMGGLFNLPEASRIKATRDSMAIHQSKAEADALSTAVDTALASKTVQRSPDQARELVKSVMEATGGSGGTVYAQGEAFREHFQSLGEDPAKAAEAMGVDPAAYSAAVVGRSSLPIPLDGFLTRFRAEDKPLLDHTKLRADGMTRAEAGVASEAMRSSVESQVAAVAKKGESKPADAERAALLDTSAERVAAVVEQQSLAAGRSATEAKYSGLVWAKGMRQLAERWNAGATERGAELMTPESIFERYRLQITSSNTRQSTAERAPAPKPPETLKPPEITFAQAVASGVGHNVTVERGGAGHTQTGEAKVGSYRLRVGAEWVKRATADGIAPRELDAAAEKLASGGDVSTTRAGRWLLEHESEIIDEAKARAAADQASLDRAANAEPLAVDPTMSEEMDAHFFQDVVRQFEHDHAAVLSPRDHSLAFSDLRRQWQKAHGERPIDTSSAEWAKLVEDSARIDASNGRVFFQPAYHGTPHKFDKFTTDHMGSGEGAQAYGWGLYFAGKKEVAEWYRESIQQNRGPRPYRFRGTPFSELPNGGLGSDPLVIASRIIREMARNDRTAEAAIAKIRGETEDDIARLEKEGKTSLPGYSGGKRALAELSKMDPADFTRDKGLLYTVDIPNDGEYLLWDKPLDEQPEPALQALDDAFRTSGNTDAISWLETNLRHASGRRTGEEAYLELSKFLGSDEAASKALLKYGAKGIKFLDGTSRNDGEGTHNYVIFDGADVAIREYEQPGNDSARGKIRVGPDKSLTITLGPNADRSTFFHESAHAYLEILTDIAAGPDAAPSIKEDMATIRAWLGAKDGEAWTRDQHEQWARGFERYLMEGKAPSISLRAAFANFARWLTDLYHSVTALKVELSPEIRRVFDKLFASEAEIAAASNQLHADPFFKDAQTAGMTPAEFARYQRDTAEAKVRAADSLRAGLMSYEKAEAIAEREKAQAEISARITAEVDARQDFQAIAALQDGKIPAGLTIPNGAKLKLDRAEIVSIYGEDALKDLPGPRTADNGDGVNQGRRVYASEGGMALEEAAILFGYKDGDDLMAALVTAPDRDHLIATRTAEEMATLYPDPVTAASLRSDAVAAMADELAGDVVSSEVNALQRQTGTEQTPRQLIRAAAERTVESMRAYTLRPEPYRVAAEKAAQRQFALQVRLHDASPEKRPEIAAKVLEAAQERLTNLELYSAARRAKERSERDQLWLKQHNTLDAREKMGKAGGWEFTAYDARNQPAGVFPTEREALAFIRDNPGHTFEKTSGYLEQWEAIQEGFALKRASNRSLRRRETLRQWISRQEADGEPVSIPDHVVDDLGRRHFQELTIAEQRDVMDSLRNVYSLALWKNRLMANKRKRDLEAVANEVASSIAANADGTVSARLGTTEREKRSEAAFGYLASMMRDSMTARALDGYKDGGAVWETFIRPRNEAAAEKSKRMAEAAEIRAKALAEWDRSPGAHRDQIPGTHLRLTREQRIGMALHWGNREGRQRVLADLARLDVPGTADDVRAVIDSLDAADVALIKATWKQLGSYWSETKSLDRRTTGLEATPVQPLPYLTKHGVLEGGYYTIKYDHTQGSKATNIDDATDAKSKLRAANLASTTRRGFTKQRVEQVQGRGLRYDFGVVSEHISEVIHDLTHRELLQDANRLFRNSTIADAIVKYHGKRVLDQLVNTTADIATGEAPAKSAGERLARRIRQGTSAALFGFNLTSAIANTTGILQAIPRVGVGRLLRSLAHVTGDAMRMHNAIGQAETLSDYMGTRARTWLREVAEANNAVTPAGRLDAIQRAGYWPMSQVQRVVDAITWHAGHELGLETAASKGLSGKDADELAVQIADQAVIDTQGSGRVGDLPAIMRGGEVSKFFTAFYGYFSTTYNLMAESIGRAVHKGEALQLATNTLLVWALPAVLTDLIGRGLRGDSSEYDWKKLAQTEASYGLGMLVGFRELSGAVQGYSYSGPGSLGMLNRAYDLIQQAGQGSADAGLLKATVGAGLAPFGLPALETQRLIDAWTIASDRGDFAAALRAALFGKARSK